MHFKPDYCFGKPGRPHFCHGARPHPCYISKHNALPEWEELWQQKHSARGKARQMGQSDKLQAHNCGKRHCDDQCASSVICFPFCTYSLVSCLTDLQKCGTGREAHTWDLWLLLSWLLRLGLVWFAGIHGGCVSGTCVRDRATCSHVIEPPTLYTFGISFAVRALVSSAELCGSCEWSAPWQQNHDVSFAAVSTHLYHVRLPLLWDREPLRCGSVFEMWDVFFV